MRHRFTVTREDRLDKLLAEHTPLSRNRARSAVEQGGVRIDGEAATAPWKVVPAGAVVEVRSVPAPDRGPDLVERYRDRWLLVVDKPAGLPSQPTREGGRLHVQGILTGRERYVALHHRLDTPASGLLLFAIDPAANAGIARALQEHTMCRLYLAVVLGDPGDSGRWDAPLDGESAITHWRRLGSAAGRSVLLVSLETGRTHQIRRHAADAGHPLLGDRRHGGAAGRAAPRLALHAVGLALEHPVRGGPLRVLSEIPADLDPTFRAAGLPSSWTEAVTSTLSAGGAGRTPPPSRRDGAAPPDAVSAVKDPFVDPSSP